MSARSGRRRMSAGARAPQSRTRALPEWAAPAAAVALSAIARLWVVGFQPHVTVDGTEYIVVAESLLAGRPQPSIFPPGYPLLIALPLALGIERVNAAVLVSLVAGALLAWPVWSLARSFLGRLPAFVAALVVALHPELMRFSALSMSESTYLLALFGALAWAARGQARTAGIALGVAFAIRPEALVPAGALLAVAAGRAARDPAQRARLAGLVLGFALVALPTTMYFRATLGTWTLTPKLGAVRAPTTDWRLDEPRGTADSAATSDAARGWIERTPEALAHYPANARAHGRSLLHLWPLPWLVLAVAGLVRRRGIEAVPLLHLLALPALGLSEQPRFVLPAIPSLAVLAAAGASWRPGRAWRAGAGVLALAGAALLARTGAREIRAPFDGRIDRMRTAGAWLAGVGSPGDLVMDRKPFVAFYARRPYRVMPDVPYEPLLSGAIRDGVRFLVVDQGVAAVYRPQLEPLLYDDAFRAAERRVEMIYVGGDDAGFGIAIFRVLREGERPGGRPPYVDPDWARFLERRARPIR